MAVLIFYDDGLIEPAAKRYVLDLSVPIGLQERWKPRFLKNSLLCCAFFHFFCDFCGYSLALKPKCV